MATALAAGQLLRCGFWCTDEEQASVNTVYYRVTAVGGTPITDQDVADYLGTSLGGAYTPILFNGATFQGVEVRLLSVAPFPSPVLSNNGSGVGTASGNGMPRQAAGLMTIRTGFGGPGYRGRLYLPFPAAGDNENEGVPTAGYVTKLDTMAAIFQTAVNPSTGGRTGSIEWVVYHSKGPGSPTTKPVVVANGVKKWATIKKRGSFGRPNNSPFA